MVRVTTKDAQGNLMGNAAFILTRANSVSRANASATASVGALTVTDAWEIREIISSRRVKPFTA